MSANDIFNSVFGLIGICFFLWIAIRSRKTYSSEDLS